jgi:hypothetical protein
VDEPAFKLSGETNKELIGDRRHGNQAANQNNKNLDLPAAIHGCLL